MNDVIAMGELLIDFTPSGEMDGQKLFMQNAGGAVANVAAALAGYGDSAAFIGMVGNDAFGQYLSGVLKDKGVDISGLVTTRDFHTTLAFVHLFDSGDRDFTFLRKPGADIMYTKDNLNATSISAAKVFHFGSLSLTDEPMRSATFEALSIAKKSGVVISYDPNYRAPLWGSPADAKEMMRKGLSFADIVKISDNEIYFLFGEIAYDDAARMLIAQGAKLVFITLGSDGAVYACAKGVGKADGYSAEAIDATGAGDCFTASVLHKFIGSGKSIDMLTLEEIAAFADFANAAASLCVQKKGGIPAMPELAQVWARQKAHG